MCIHRETDYYAIIVVWVEILFDLSITLKEVSTMYRKYYLCMNENLTFLLGLVTLLFFLPRRQRSERLWFCAFIPMPFWKEKNDI